MKTLLLTTLLISILGAVPSAFAAPGYYSAHSCQVLGPKSSVAYHSAGSLIALTNNVRITCPLSTGYMDSTLSVRVFFSTRGAVGSPQNMIKCRVNKIFNDDTSVSGSPRGAGIRITDELVLRNSENRIGTVGANILCEVSRGSKILAYELF